MSEKISADRALTIALSIIQPAMDLLRTNFGKNLKISYKSRIDPVTNIDIQSSSLIIKYLKRYTPEIPVLCEETKDKVDYSDIYWVLDPLDGTVNYLHGVPIFSISLALLKKSEVLVGVVADPMRNEVFYTCRGDKSYLNGKTISVNRISRMERALVVTGFPYRLEKSFFSVMKNFSRVVRQVQGIRRLGSAALDLCYVAGGRFAAFWEEGLNLWDVAAGSLIVENAGGKLSTYHRKNGNYLFEKNILASNGVIHRKILALLKSEN